ncbi:hypothetical protein D9756_008440 [Leucocoprinus leucothites]|uniref:Uncharacterized protein n=1 Tax=Leucocoprinus leucothites TaxID=201217 RepID=A0A8H5D1Z6_9AGAR|nr:hypothetical protein D9756_008440 [Leucoagaricus leucothites]
MSNETKGTSSSPSQSGAATGGPASSNDRSGLGLPRSSPVVTTGQGSLTIGGSLTVTVNDHSHTFFGNNTKVYYTDDTDSPDGRAQPASRAAK